MNKAIKHISAIVLIVLSLVSLIGCIQYPKTALGPDDVRVTFEYHDKSTFSRIIKKGSTIPENLRYEPTTIPNEGQFNLGWYTKAQPADKKHKEVKEVAVHLASYVFTDSVVLVEKFVDEVEVADKGALQVEVKKAIKVDPYMSLGFIDVSKVKDMSGLFSADEALGGDKAFKDLKADISSWNVKSVENFSNMFAGSNFAGDISKWDTRSAVNMSGMFKNAKKFNSNIVRFQVEKLTNVDSMFEGATAFAQDLSAWGKHLKADPTHQNFAKGTDAGLWADAMLPKADWNQR